MGTYRSIFKTLKFSSRKTKFYIILLIHSRKKNPKSTNFAFINRLWKIKVMPMKCCIYTMRCRSETYPGCTIFLVLLNEDGLLSLMNDKNFVVWGRWVLIIFKNKFLRNKIAYQLRQEKP